MIPLLIFLAITLLILLSAYLCYRVAFSVPKTKEADLFRLPDTDQYRKHSAAIERMGRESLKIPYEEVWIRGDDGAQLFGRYYEFGKGAPLEILFHGYKSNAMLDFSGSLSYAAEHGCNVLLVDQRAHGKSGGKCLTFGIMERYDCLLWAQYAAMRFGPDTKILLYGMSMGAATVLMATALKLPKNVIGVVADCGYTSPKDIVKKVMRDYKLWVPFFYPFVWLGAMIFGRFNLGAASAEEAMKTCTLPVLFIHGEDDRFVPCEMSRKNYETCVSDHKTILTVPNAGHGLSYMEAKEKYLDAVNTFWQEILK